MTKTLLLAVTSFLTIAAPVFGRGLTPEDLASLARLSDPEVSPDGSIVAFVLRETDQDANRRRADIWLIDVDDSEAGPRRLTDHESNDSAPQWSADNDAVYFISSRSGSDQVWRIPTDGGEAAQVTDYPVDVANLRVAPGGDRIAFTANVFPDCDTLTCTEDRLKAEDKDNHSGMLHETLLVRHWDTWEDGRRSALFTAELDDDGVADGDPVEVSGDLDGDVPSVPFDGREEIAFSPDGNTLYFALREAGQTEAWSTNFDIFGGPADGSAAPENLTPENKAVWSYRWNPQTYTAQGYGVATVDFHGSRSYGQDFVDSINGDWGGKPLVDLQKGLAAAIAQYPWLEEDNACALGASYGGYMINWIAGNWPDRFECLVNHDGIFDLRSFYYSTEELWFPEWDFGAPYYEAPEDYERWNPVNYVSKWQTPMLVVQGLLDFRVPPGQGLAAFTALQRQGIPSELLIFPDENHWVLSPGNSIQWHDTVAAWLKRYLKDEEAGR